MPTLYELTTNDPKILLERIKSEFPSLKWNNYEFINSGWDHEVIILDNKIVFRFPNSKEYLDLLKNEINVLNDLRSKVRINIPNYTYVENKFKFAGYPIIPGERLLTGYFNGLDESTRSKVAVQLAEFLNTIHGFQNGITTKLPTYIYSDQKRLKHQTPKFLKSVLSADEYCIAEKIIDDIDIQLTTNFPRIFIHGDIFKDHLFWDKVNERLGLIDFSDMCIGDPAFDFAGLNDYGEGFVRDVIDRYNGPKDNTLFDRARNYWRWGGVHMLVDHFISHKTTFEDAKKEFDNVKRDLM